MRKEHLEHMDCHGSEAKEKFPTGISDQAALKKESSHPFSLVSLELLNKYGSGLTRFNKEILDKAGHETTWNTTSVQEISTAEIMKAAIAGIPPLFSQKSDDLPMRSHLFRYDDFGICYEDAKYVLLAQSLLVSAKMVGIQQFYCANEMLGMCDQLSSNIGNPVQRVVYYFAEALRERIDRETGRNMSKGLEGNESRPFDMDQEILSLKPSVIACHQDLPFIQVAHFAGMQTILENVSSAKKVHLIDLAIRNGSKWTVLMQALAARHECPLELLKMTAVGTSSKEGIEETCKRLACFAETMNLPFSFKVVMVSSMKDLKEDMFDLEAGETVAVCSTTYLRTMLARPDHLESLMKVIRNLHPCVMVVIEIDANTNTPVFMDRFIEALFFFSALFDCVEACMDQENPSRITIESIYLANGIRDIITTEGEEMANRHLNIDAWRAFFATFGMVEVELSTSSLYQANLVVQKLPCWSSCTLDMNGKCLLVGWKGTPAFSLSVWNFHQERGKKHLNVDSKSLID